MSLNQKDDAPLLSSGQKSGVTNKTRSIAATSLLVVVVVLLVVTAAMSFGNVASASSDDASKEQLKVYLVNAEGKLQYIILS